MDDFPPYARGSDTSFNAAASVEELTGRLRRQVYSAIDKYGDRGLTCDEVEVALGLRHQTASARINELSNRAFIIDSGRRRKTRSGRDAVVWVVKQAA